jgi:RimJ/RimL family protein N-acetyltransferase
LAFGPCVYTKAGFRLAGRLREGQWVDGEPHDIIYMDCLAREFQG